MNERLVLFDHFTDDRASGTVIGSVATSGHKRLGVDAERVLSIDNAALRIAPLLQAGFGRSAIAYGPFHPRNGLAFAVNILNGHNTSQAETLPDTFRERLSHWLKGSGVDSRWIRLIRWLRSGQVRRTVRQFRWWKRMARDSRPVARLDENLAVGWFPSAVVSDPRREGYPFIMHALGPENGELWIGGNGSRTRALRGVQNLPLYLISVIREGGMVYYVSSIGGALGLAAHPQIRPVGIARCAPGDDLFLGIQQAVLGQIGFRLDTRVKAVRVAHVAGYDSWCGGAHAADRLAGSGDLDGSAAEIGGGWQVLKGEARRGATGAIGSAPGTLAVLDPGAASGLIHSMVSLADGRRSRFALVWRFLNERNCWRLEVSSRTSEIILVEDGKRHVMASRALPDPHNAEFRYVQVLDGGSHFIGYVDGEPLSEGWLSDTRFERATGVGILFDIPQGDSPVVRLLEAHPRQLSIPEALALDSPWFRIGERIVIADDFKGDPGDLDGRLTSVGGQRWSKVMGAGVIETTGDGAARIRASVDRPCPGRTAYCIDWKNDDFADLEVTITPPGTRSGERQRGIAGFILYQDARNYVTLNVWRADYYEGASISTFFMVNGYEDLYDAIWTNIGNRVTYGKPSLLRLCCDGDQYLVFVNDEPVLYRAFRDVYPDYKRLRIRKVGLLANWEFGNDTGSSFEQFRSRL